MLICDFCDIWRAEILAPGANWEGGRAESAKEYAQREGAVGIGPMGCD